MLAFNFQEGIANIVLFELRDYYDEIQASVNIASTEWKIQNLCVWADLVVETAPSMNSHGGVDERSIEDYEAEVDAAEFAALRCKIAKLFWNTPNKDLD